MIFSRITSKAQTTLPRAIRVALGLKEGDRIAYQIDGDRVILTRVETVQEDPFATFSEWSGDEDARAYADL
jgi:antitoxin PrlF